MEKNSLGRDAIADFEQITGVPVWSIITIREVCDYLKNRENDGTVVLDEDIFLKIEHHLEEHSVR
jgi:orotate phosphoribosyltransferase